MADITFSRSLGILMDALMASLQEILKLSDEQLNAFTADFEARLPDSSGSAHICIIQEFWGLSIKPA